MFNGPQIMRRSRKRRAGSPAFHRSRRGLAALLGLLVFAGPAVCNADASVSKEYLLKAAFLYNFTKFVEWPPKRFANETSPIVIGVLGWNWNPFSDELINLVSGKKVGGRPVIVKNVETPEEASAVHVLFVTAGLEQRWFKGLKSAPNTGVLTVGESEEFAADGGIITFILKEDNVRFEINQDAGKDTGLKISAQLLKLAIAGHRKT